MLVRRSAFLASGTTVVLLGVATCRVETRESICVVCGSKRLEVERGFGWPTGWSVAVPTWPSSDDVQPSDVDRTFFGESHRHDWALWLASSGGLFSSHGHGRGRTGPLQRCLEWSPAARDHVLAAIRSGDLDVQRLERLLRAPGRYSGRPSDPTEQEMLALLAECQKVGSGR